MVGMKQKVGTVGTASGGILHRRRWAVAAVMAVLASTVVAIAPPGPAGATPNVLGQEFPTGLTIKGSVEQIYVLNAVPGVGIKLDGGTPLNANSSGAMLFRNVSAGSHSVQVGIATPVNVTVQADSLGEGSRFTPQAQAMKTDENGKPVNDYIKTADGTLLGYRVELPSTPGPWDVVVLYSGYRAGLDPAEPWEETLYTKLTAAGYAVVGVNMRGSGCSGGAFDVMERLVGRDGYDAIETIAAQDWSNEVAMAGASWLGISQLFVAQFNPPNLAAIAPGAAVADFYRDIVYPGGVKEGVDDPAHPTGFVFGWGAARDLTNAYNGSPENENGYTGDRALPVGTPTTLTTCGKNQALRYQNRKVVTDFADPSNATYNDYWVDRTANLGAIDAPTLLVDSWHDEETGSHVAAAFDHLRNGRLVAVPDMHGAYVTPDVFNNEVLPFLDRYLAPTAAKIQAYGQRPKVNVELESSPNPARYLQLNAFDIPYNAAKQVFPLEVPVSGVEATNTLRAERGSSATSSFVYQPGTGAFTNPVANHDETSFTSDALTSQRVMAGSGSVNLWILPEGTDLNLQVSLIEVRNDGYEQLVQSGWVRASHGQAAADDGTPRRPRLLHAGAGISNLTPGQWTEVRVELLPFGHVFRVGSRIKLQVDAPGGAGQAWWGMSGEAHPDTTVVIGHGGTQLSEAVLPVVSNPVIVDANGASATPATTAPACHLPPYSSFGEALVAAVWHPCRPSPTTTFSAQVTQNNLVTFTSQSTGAPWNLAAILGPQLVGNSPATPRAGSVIDAGFAAATGTTSFRAPAGTHRYTLTFANSYGVNVHSTIVVDVPGFTPSSLTLPSPPTTNQTIQWLDTADSYWVSLDGNGLHGWTPLTNPTVTINKSLLTTGSHTVRLTACVDNGSCTSEFAPVSPIAGTITYATPTTVTALGNQSSLIATITPTGGGAPIKIYSPYPGIVWERSVTDGTVAQGEMIARILIDASLSESMPITVG
jgi:predicted acyl esterase